MYVLVLRSLPHKGGDDGGDETRKLISLEEVVYGRNCFWTGLGQRAGFGESGGRNRAIGNFREIPLARGGKRSKRPAADQTKSGKP